MELQTFQHDMDKLLITLFLSQNAGINISDTLALKSFRGVAYQYNFTIHALEIQPDHVYLFVGFPPSYSVSQVVQLFKGNSAYRILYAFPSLRKTHFHRGHFWSADKFYRSVGNVTSDTIQHYI